MRPVFQFLIFVFFFTPFIYSQIVFDSIKVSDEAGASKVLYFGIDPDATDGIDIQFGESDLPPFPPMGAFEARFQLPAQNYYAFSSHKDFRKADVTLYIPFTGQKQFRIKYQPGDGTVIKISWNFPSYIEGLLTDMFNGLVICQVMRGEGSYTIQEPYDYEMLKFLVEYVAVVPVELISFISSVTGSSVILEWTTSTETNNSGFEVHRRTENSEWIKVGFVNGAGTTTEVNSYSFSDNNLPQGNYFYRLKQLDYSGEFTYTKVVEAFIDLIPAEFKLSQNYPNPFNPSTEISFSLPHSEKVSIIVYDMLGREVKTLFSEEVQAGTYNTIWNGLNNAGEQMSSGNYIYRMAAGDFIQSRKMIYLK
jgi:5-hydroxyisourate hydrolase-like protein (transthyretin family)